MIRKIVVATILGVLMCARRAIAPGRTLAGNQRPREQVSFTKDSSGNGINQHATDTGGFLLSYSLSLSIAGWRPTRVMGTPGTRTELHFSSQFGVQANVHQATGALVVTAPHRIFRLAPYVLAVPVPSVFDPTGNAGGSVSGAQSQSKACVCLRRRRPTTTSAGTSHFAPNTVVSSTGALTLICSATLRHDHAHSPALARYRLSLLKQPYRDCGRAVRFTPVGARGRGGDTGCRAEIESNSNTRGEDSGMTSKAKRN